MFLHHILAFIAYTLRENRDFVFIIIVQFMMSSRTKNIPKIPSSILVDGRIRIMLFHSNAYNFGSPESEQLDEYSYLAANSF